MAECAAFYKRTGRIIKLLSVRKILNEEHVQKLSPAAIFILHSSFFILHYPPYPLGCSLNQFQAERMIVSGSLCLASQSNRVLARDGSA